MSFVLGIDLGTSSTKTVLLDENGNVVAHTSASYPLLTPQPHWVEQHPADWWRAVCETIRAVLADSPIRPLAVSAVSLSGQMNGAAFVDAHGNPLRPAPLWLDGRSTRECDEAQEKAGDLLRDLALHRLNPVNVLAKILWAQKHEPDVYAASHKVLIPKDWVRFKLTGQFASDVSDASVSAAFDLRKREWAWEILDALNVRHDLFPPVFESTAVVGYVTPPAAEETGLAVGTPVCAGGGDMACLAVGGGVIAPGVVSVTIGTAGHATTFAENVSDAAFNQLWPMCHAVAGKYFWLGCSYTGGASLAWFKDNVWNTQHATRNMQHAFDLMTAEAATAPPCCEGLFFLPWLAGTATPHPDANARGCFIGLTLRHARAHLVRALMEGVVYDVRHCLECFKRLNLPLHEIRIGEGGAKSLLWRQIQADVFGQPVRLMETEDASAVGAALIAGVGVGVWRDFAEACGRTIRLGETIEPTAENVARYERGYRLYSRFYDDLKETFHAMAE
jgi:xylulokinase